MIGSFRLNRTFERSVEIRVLVTILLRHLATNVASLLLVMPGAPHFVAWCYVRRRPLSVRSSLLRRGRGVGARHDRIRTWSGARSFGGEWSTPVPLGAEGSAPLGGARAWRALEDGGWMVTSEEIC